MSDTKLRPEDLTSEERALWDQMALRYREMHFSWSCAYSYSRHEALEAAKARRALFAPAPEKVAKVETMADRIAADLKAGTFRGEQPAPPEPAARVCPNCLQPEEQSHFTGNLTGDGGWYSCPHRAPVAVLDRLPTTPAPAAPNLCNYPHCDCRIPCRELSCGQPASPDLAAEWNENTPALVGFNKPEPAAHPDIDSSCCPDEGPLLPKPAAMEVAAPMPYTAEWVRAWIRSRGYLSPEQHEEFGHRLPTSSFGACMESLAEALEVIEQRNLAQPAAPEMPEAVTTKAERGLEEVYRFNDGRSLRRNGVVFEEHGKFTYRDVLSKADTRELIQHFERNLAQPVMTDDLERLLVQVESAEVAYRLQHGCYEAAHLLTDMCAAVRAHAAPVNGSTPIMEYDPDMKPAAPDMPLQLQLAVEALEHQHKSGVAEGVKSWWRNLAQPVAVGMTEELERMLRTFASGEAINVARLREICNEYFAVRAQAAQVKP